MFGDDVFSSFVDGNGRPMSQGPCKAPPVENVLPCNLEDLYKGTTKKMKISSEIADASGYILFCLPFQFSTNSYLKLSHN